MESYFGDLQLARLLLEKGISSIYIIAFLNVLFQFRPLLGMNGLLPVPDYLKQTTFSETPSIFHLYYSDNFLRVISIAGLILSACILSGLLSDIYWPVYVIAWLTVWFIYLSIVNVGQTFYSFGWESMLLEAGFFAAFLGPSDLEPSFIPVVILRWMLFRVELGAGLIKVRHDPCWRDLTCLFYHYETQPMPGPLSRYFHHFPGFVHRFGVAFSHFVQIIVPFGLFAPQPFAEFAGLLIIAHQLWLILCGNYSWLNWLTVVLGFSAFGNSVFDINIVNEGFIERPVSFDILLYFLLVVTLILSRKPLLNFFKKDQLMNFSYNPYHLVGVYGAFGSVTKERFEIILEGCHEDPSKEAADWKPYEFKGKPGDISRVPGQYAPYHLRLDWAMWFLPFSVAVSGDRIGYVSTTRWFLRLIEKLLKGDVPVQRLMKHSPFVSGKPKFIRALYYRYEFTSADEYRNTGNTWKRKLIGEYLRPTSLSDIRQFSASYY